eukprot:GHVQ01017088.1.p1 GENE.GHVQ01017088.1~~GHVQ01017088.1.p1  ORF type:complete len:194 (-),score=3.59 GHVQ01017088.1:1198-1779(-)
MTYAVRPTVPCLLRPRTTVLYVFGMPFLDQPSMLYGLHTGNWDGPNNSQPPLDMRVVFVLWNCSGSTVQSVAWSRSQRYLLSSGTDGQSRIWDIRRGSQILVIGKGARSKHVAGSVFVCGEQFIAHSELLDRDGVSMSDGLHIFDAFTGKLLTTFEDSHLRTLRKLVAAKSCGGIATAGNDGTCKVLEITGHR